MAIKLIIGADVAPTESNLAAFSAGELIPLIGDALAVKLLSADFRLFGLESPLIAAPDPIVKYGPALSAPVDCAAGVAALTPSAVLLANNHILDHGESGLLSTLDALSIRGIPYIGAGKTLLEAQKGVVFDVRGFKIGVYACAEHEFSLATPEKGGANPFDPLETPDHIRALRKDCDYLIAVYHGGREHYPYPSPLLQKRLRKLVGVGADLVLCQHGHCVACSETYRGKTIVYGQGNFLFDAPDAPACWDDGLLISVAIEDGAAHVNYLPIVRVPGGVRLAEGARSDGILSGFFLRSEEIMQEGFIAERYEAYVRQIREKYLNVFLGDSKLLRGLNALSGRRPTETFYQPSSRVRLYDHIACQSLRELLLEALKLDAF